MRLLPLALLPLLAASGPARPAPPAPAFEPPLVITGVTVIDANGRPPAPNRTVVVVDGRIAAVGAADSVQLPPGAQVVDGAGKYLVPGLWDMHVHTAYATPAQVERILFPALVASGVLGVRDVASRFPLQQSNAWRAAIADGRLVGPRLAAVGRNVDGAPVPLRALVARDETEARRAVEAARREGYDFLKPYNHLPLPAYRALAEEARRQGVALAGHVPHAVDAGEASDAGQRSIEHLTNLWFEVSVEEDAIRRRILELQDGGASALDLFREKIDRLMPLAFRTHDAERERELWARFARNGTWQTPTLINDRYFVHFAEPRPAADSALRHLPRAYRQDGRELARFLGSLTPAQVETLRELYRREAAMVGAMQRAGVGILAGSDAPLPYVAPGFGLHDELEALVRDAGLTPAEALRAATLNPARYLELQDSLGTVEPGKAADLVLLDADPLADIRNTRRIRAVVRAGKLLDRAALDALLAGAAREAQR